jgi:hypothetical protein
MPEEKEFDQVFTKKENKLETFKDEPKKVEEKKEPTEWEKYFQNLNDQYGKTVREVGQKNIYTISVDGKDVQFTRKRLSVKELRWLAAKQKEYDEKPKDSLSLFEAEELASLYLEFAQMLLVNTTTNEPITKDEFETQEWGKIRSIVDNCILKSLVGTTG